jgi:hypothetical protein
VIEIVQGLGVGAGKTYYVFSERVIHTLRRGGTVCVSDKFVVYWDKLCALVAKRYGVQLERDQFISVPAADVWRLHELTPAGTDDNPVLIVVDEAQQSLHTRDSRDQAKRALFDWCCESRHDNNDLIFISQHALNIDVQVRRLATNIVRVKNMATFKIAGMQMPKFLVASGFGFLCVTMDQSEKVVQDRRFISQDKEIFACYESKACKGAHKRAQENAVARKDLKKVETKKMRYAPMLVLLFLVGGCCLAVPRVWAAWHPPKKETPGSPAPAGASKTAEPGRARAGSKRYAEAIRSYSPGWVIDGRMSPETVVTDQGTYIPGELCQYGEVISIRRPRPGWPLCIVKVRDGEEESYIIADVREPREEDFTQTAIGPGLDGNGPPRRLGVGKVALNR